MTWDRTILAALPARGGVILAGDERIERYSEDTMMRGSPDAVVVARDEQEVAEILGWCDAHGVPATICGSQTSMTGASVATEGLLISTEKLEGLLDIGLEEGEPVAVVRPGTVVADLQRAVQEAGYFYPVAPTSRDECRIGSNVATNATGEDSYRYGPLRPYARRLELILPSGERRVLERAKGESPSWERNRAGYFTSWENPIDLVVGSEGTLGFVAKVTFDLLPRAPEFFSALLPMPSSEAAIAFVVRIAAGKARLNPRALEFVDEGALAVMRTAEGFPSLPDGTRALLYIKQECLDGAEHDALLDRWYAEASAAAVGPFADGILVAQTREEQEAFRLWRHHIPETENERGRAFWAAGGGKVGSDWWVPVPRLSEMMDFFYRTARGTGLPFIAYAHLGSGHPHTNLLGRDAAGKSRALEALRACCRKAVELGGGVAGEHGIGKLHTDLMPIQHPPEMIERMMAWKREYDPRWTLGKGNIFAGDHATR